MPPSDAARFAHAQALDDARRELLLAKLAVPSALVFFLALVSTGLGRFVARTFFGMWLHELGHAVAAWLCGLPAFPGPWLTPVAGARSTLFALSLTAGLAYGVWRGWAEERRLLFAAAAATLAVQLLCTLGISLRAAQTFVTYSGNAGAMVLGAALMATFFVPPDHKLHRDWLRWGFLVIGAAAFADTFGQWWRARTDMDAVGLGQFERGGLTDASKLVGQGWAVFSLTRQYLGIGVLSLVVLGLLQFFHVQRVREALLDLEARWQRELRRGAS